MYLDCHLFYNFLNFLMFQNFEINFEMTALIYIEEQKLEEVLLKNWESINLI